MKPFTDPKVKALPLELRCCYFVQGWNLDNSHINNVDEWAEKVGWLAYYSNLDESSRDDDVRAAVLRAKERVARLMAFVASHLD